MSRATRHLERYLERLLEELQSDSTRGDSGACDGLFPPASDSAGVDGSCDPLGKETTASSRVSLVSNSESDASTPSGCDCAKYYHEETAKLVQQLGDSRVQVATLEAQIEFLTSKVEERETLDSLYIQRLEEDVLRLEETVELEVSDLARRQNEVELKVPSLEEKFRTIKDFDVSEALYMELKSIPEQRRTAREHILILAYEKFLRDREEIQELRISRDTSREALTRANDEVQRLTDDLHRVAANHAIEHRESELDLSANLVLIEQLEAERRDSRVQIEVLSAQGSLFDEVRGKLENLQSTSIDAENEKAVMAAALQVALQEKEILRGAIKEKDHSLDLLSMDKTYLSKEVESSKEQVRKLESELEQQHEKLREVKRERTELRKDSLAANERFQAEILRIKEHMNQDIELRRRESNAIADEKVRIFREMRDEAMAAAEMCRTELRESKAAYEELLFKFRELQRVADSKEAEIQRNLTLTNCELDQLKVVLAETKNSLDQTRLENEALIVKLKTQTEKFKEEKNSVEESLFELKEELKITRDQLEVFQREEAAKLESLEREKAKSFSAWRGENTVGNEGKLKDGVHENQLLDQPRCITKEKERVSVRLHSVQGDIRKLLRARSSVELLQSLLKEKGVPIGGPSRSNSITNYSRSSLKDKKAVSPRISNLDRSASPTRQELEAMIQHGETPPRCYQHRACSPHYPKAYEELVDALSRQAPAPFSHAPTSASFSSAPAPTSAPFSRASAPFSVDRNSCS